MAPNKRTRIDWEKGHKLIIGTKLSKSEIARQLGCSEAAVRKRIKEKDLSRDLTSEIQAQARSTLVREEVRSDSESANPISDDQIIKEAGAIVASVLKSHRTSIGKRRKLVSKLYAELEQLTDGQEDIADIVEGLKARNLDVFRKTIEKISSMPSRIKGVSDLIKAEDLLIKMERKAFNIESAPQEGEEANGAISDTERAARVAAIFDRARTRRTGQTD
jgi:predicted transcriptional regulator